MSGRPPPRRMPNRKPPQRQLASPGTPQAYNEPSPQTIMMTSPPVGRRGPPQGQGQAKPKPKPRPQPQQQYYDQQQYDQYGNYYGEQQQQQYGPGYDQQQYGPGYDQQQQQYYGYDQQQQQYATTDNYGYGYGNNGYGNQQANISDYPSNAAAGQAGRAANGFRKVKDLNSSVASNGSDGGGAYLQAGNTYSEPLNTSKLNNGNRFDSTYAPTRDLVWVVLFASHLIGFLTLLGVYVKKNIAQAFILVPALNALRVNLGVLVFLPIFISTLFSVLSYIALRNFAAAFVYSSVGLSLVGFLVFSIVMFVQKNVALGVIALLLFLGYATFAVIQRKSFNFAIGILSLAANVVVLFNEHTTGLLLNLVMYALYIAAWFSAGFFVAIDFLNGVNPAVTNVAIAFLVFSFYFVFQISAAELHFVSNSISCEWFFKYPNMSSDFFSRPFRRSLSSSIGSLAYHAIAYLYYFPYNLAVGLFESGSSVNSIRKGIIGGLSSFSYMTMYGMGYSDASKGVAAMLEKSGFATIVLQDANSTILMFIPLLGAAASGIPIFFFTNLLNPAGMMQNFVFVLAAFFVGYGFTRITMQVFLGTIMAFHVCFAEDRPQLESSKPQAYGALSSLYNQYYPEVVSGVGFNSNTFGQMF